MDRLWAPWRSAYIYGEAQAGCIFCVPKKRESAADKRRLVIQRSVHTFSVLNRFPYNNGHVMIAPYRHVGSLDKLKDQELQDMMKLVNRTIKALDGLLRPSGYNIGMNIGRTAGAGFRGHVHIHIVPRWNGDTNFMPVLAGTKVISESLGALYKKLKARTCSQGKN